AGGVGLAISVPLYPGALGGGASGGAGMGRFSLGAAPPPRGGVAAGARVFAHPQCHHMPEVYDGIGATEAAALLQGFFAERR
ncbi:MAG: nucleoside deaminase, partial [Gemmobacter sp.]